MTEQPAQSRPMTPNQLRAVVYRIAVTYLEVERRLRSPDQLRAFLSPAEYRRHRITRRGQHVASRPVRPTDVRKVRLDAATPDRVNGSVLVRRDDDRWSSLLVDLRQTGHGWTVDRLDRLERLVPREPRHVEIDEEAIDRRRRFVEAEQRAVEAATTAASRRYERLPDKRVRGARALRDDRDRWRARLEELQAEGALLDRGRQADHGPAKEPRDGEHPRVRPAVETVLGPRPDEPDRAEVWDQAEQALVAYAELWDLDPSTAVLRVACIDAQEAERRALLQVVARAAHELEPATSRDLTLSVQEQAIVSLDS